MTALDRDGWSRLLAHLDEPPVGTVAEALADARDLDVLAAYDVVETALEEGILVEENTGAAFGVVRLAETDEPAETAKTGDMEPRGADSLADDPQGEDAETGVEDRGSWDDADFTTTNADTYPPELLERVQWMGHREKLPFAPWADRDHPEADPDGDARFKWGLEANYVDGETVAIAEDDHRLDGRVFLQQHDDPYAFVDGDDVRDPETDEVHPEFIAVLEALGVTYADVSVSGGGVHAYYRGDLPRGLPEVKFTIDDEPWGANDDEPAVEIYANKHVCVATGDHVAGTPRGVAEWDDDALKTLLDEYDELPEEPTTDREEYDLDGYEPAATGSDETTDDIRDIFRALDRLDPKHVGERTIVREWTQDRRAFLPVWGSSDDGGTANYIDDRIWHDTGRDGGYGGPAVMAAIDAGLIRHTGATPADVSGETFFKAIDHLRDLGFSIPELEHDETDDETDDEEYRTDPRDVGATVDPRRAWDAAGRVGPADLPEAARETLETDGDAFVDAGETVDVVRAVALAEGLVETADEPLDDKYPEAYALASETYGAPLPEYYTEADAIDEGEAVLELIGEVTFWDLDTDAFASDITAEDDAVGGDAVRALDPAWRPSDSGTSVLVFDSGTIWDADTERVLDPLRFVALDSGLTDDPGDPVAGETFTEAYRRLREEYDAPLPYWYPADDGNRTKTPQLPPAEELVDARDLDGVATDALEAAREDVETLVAAATAETGAPTVVTALPATGKTTGAIKTAGERPLSYLAPRKELQAQALDKADRWGVDAEVLPVLSEERVRDEVLAAAVSHVREHGKTRLRDRWAILSAAFDELEEDDDDLDPADIFAEEDDDADSVALDRPTCPTAEGEHGVAWALAVHVARRLGYTPREIHTDAGGLFGADLPCTDEDHDDGACEYGRGWERVRDADDPPDLLVGSRVHAHVPSTRTHYTRGADGEVETAPRAVVLDEFPGEAYVSKFDDHADDFAAWLAGCLRDDVETVRDMIEAGLGGDDWVRAWLDSDAADGDDHVADAIETIGRAGDLRDAREAAEDILDEVDPGALEALDLREPLGAVVDDTDPATAYDGLVAALDAVDPNHPASGLASWAADAVRDPLETATAAGGGSPTLEAVDVDALPVAGDLRDLVTDALEAGLDGRDHARERLDAARTALRGGAEGCRRLAAWADDGYAHPDAYHLLGAVVEPEPQRVTTSSWAFDPDATDGTTVDVVETGARATTVLDRNGHGARLHTPPARTTVDGDDVPLVGLDATGRAPLWSVALGEEVATADIHDTPRERAEFLEDALDLRVLQAADRPRPYEGDPTTKDTDGDAALLEEIADEYAGIDAPRQRGDAPVEVGRPAAITTKSVREVLEGDSRLDDVVAEWDHYGNVTGSNELGAHRLAAVLGSQHYGDDAIERFCALAGEEVDTSRDAGRGAALEYGSPLADEYLRHMREDQTTQAILRFARGDSGATVVARTSALREDLPVVGRAQVVETWSDTASRVARAYRRLGTEFTIGDVADAVDVSRRQVRRVLAELADAGYLERVTVGDGIATEYRPADTPGAGEVELPAREDAVDATPGHTAHNQYYTWNVRVFGGDPALDTAPAAPARPDRAAPPAPPAIDTGDPPT